MKKLVNGIIEFRKKLRPEYRETFKRLALGQSPDALFIGCSDSRVAVNVFASTDPGDLFVTRNVGNIIPPFDLKRSDGMVASERAVVEFAVDTLNVKNVIVCGHSECGAMRALVDGHEKLKGTGLYDWLTNAEPVLKELEQKKDFAPRLSKSNRASQLNVLLQIEHLKTYPLIQKRLQSKELKIHGWWFELGRAEVFSFNETKGAFVLFDEAEAERVLGGDGA